MTAMPASLQRSFPRNMLPQMKMESPVRVEIASDARLAKLFAEWNDLVARAAEDNAMMHPALLGAAMRSYPGRRPLVLLAWTRIDGGERLAGIWGFARHRASKSILPGAVLRAPSYPHAFLATPVVDRDLLEVVLEAMLDATAQMDDCPKTIAIDSMGAGGPTMAALERVLCKRHSAPIVLEQRSRPRLETSLATDAYLKGAMSGSSRKKLRQLRNRLTREGVAVSEVVSDPGRISGELEEFLALEHSGWKGRKGTSILGRPADAAFFRDAFCAMAGAGAASIHSLRLDGRPLAMQLVLRAGSGAFTWKTAFDEDFARFSPGTLLFEDYTRHFLDDETIRFVDSCSEDDSGYMATWTERQSVADLRLSAVRGAGLAFTVVNEAEKRFRLLRSMAKQVYHKLRK